MQWAGATAQAFVILIQEVYNEFEVAMPEWWNDEGLKALSARVVRAAPNNEPAFCMRAAVLSGQCGAWKEGPRSAAELMEAAAHFDRAAALTNYAPALKGMFARCADQCRSRAGRQAVAM